MAYLTVDTVAFNKEANLSGLPKIGFNNIGSNPLLEPTFTSAALPEIILPAKPPTVFVPLIVFNFSIEQNSFSFPSICPPIIIPANPPAFPC